MISRSKSKGAVDLQKKQTLAEQARRSRCNIPNAKYNKNLVRSKSSPDLNFHKKDSSPNSSDPQQAKEKFGTLPAMEERSVHAAPPLQKANLEE
ncbi:hypothetical protein DVH24_012857 [Malus domestica]|uniref:Uncharacterized protein n=1 Tax=Malus domestica TaxID=3750 RepID=A0A498HW84_MALDO|nr:hypothetical protein DVH24_012857 [Malus domestica]